MRVSTLQRSIFGKYLCYIRANAVPALRAVEEAQLQGELQLGLVARSQEDEWLVYLQALLLEQP